jgi:hypothetical protein
MNDLFKFTFYLMVLTSKELAEVVALKCILDNASRKLAKS